uniref:ATP-binding cassette domain-containing protein n=1 Tax=Treponema saccharophilum TaxID=165 RepID=UPI0038696F99
MLGNIRIQNVEKSFDDVKVLNDFSLDIKPGSFVSLIGPSGCGKSTLLRIIGGLEKASSGQIFLDGEKITKAGRDRGFAFQGSNLFPWL